MLQPEPQIDSRRVIDSLKVELTTAELGDSLLPISKLYRQIGRAYEVVHNDSAIAWYQGQVRFLKETDLQSEKIDSLIGSVYLDLSYLLGFIGYPTEIQVEHSLAYADSAYAVLKAPEEFELAIRAYNNKGLALINQNRYEEALEELIKALELTSQVLVDNKREYALQGLYLNIGKAYIGLEQWPLALNYSKKAVSIFNVLRFKMIALNNVAAIFLETEQPDSSLKYAELSYSLADSIQDDYHRLLTKVNQAEALLKLKRYDEALPIIEGNIELSTQFDYPYGIASGLNQKANYFAGRGDYRAALEILQKAEGLAPEVSDKELLIDTWGNLEEVYVKLGNYSEAYSFQVRRDQLKDSLHSVQNTKNFNELLLRFQMAEKEKQIVEQELELKRKEASLAKRDLQILIVSTSLVLLLLGSLTFVFRTRQLQERKVQNAVIAEKEKGLSAVISATEEERKRISKDLHDGIGQKLTALKPGIINLAPQLQDKELKQQLDQISNEFSKSAEELRQISHQMMPKALMEQGLIQALEDLLENTFKFSPITCNFEYYKVEGRYAERLEVSVYRIAQELLNNALKHARATEIHMQLMELDKQLILIVEDKGKGFDSGLAQGQGLYNIKSRLDIVKGVVNYEPEPETGMLATVTIPLSWR